MRSHGNALLRGLPLALLMWVTACVTPLKSSVEETLVPPELEGVRWGFLVSNLEGRELIKWRPDQRFLPASNTKVMTALAAFYLADELEALADQHSTRIYLSQRGDGEPADIVLVGRGDPAVSDEPDCEIRCLVHLAEAVRTAGITEVHNVIGDDTWFPDERWPPGWSWEDLSLGYGTAISALTVNENELTLLISPGPAPGDPATVQWDVGDNLYPIESSILTVEDEETAFRVDRESELGEFRLYGVINWDDAVRRITLGVDDPAAIAAERFRRRLQEVGIAVSGGVTVRHAASRGSAPTTSLKPLSRLPSIDWIAMHERISKDSNNLNAELMLRHVARIEGHGTTDEGLAQIKSRLDSLEVSENGYDLFDGSGMSVYNRVSPRTLVTYLRDATDQDWFEDWRATLPVGGEDGSLKRRFVGTSLEGRIFAKTGTLKGTNALSGYMIAKSGRMLVFSIIANERPLAIGSAVPYMDEALVKIAEAF